MKQIIIPIFLLFVACRSSGQTPIVHSIFLIGDAGEPAIVSQPLGSSLKAQVDSARNSTTVLFLGDNIYPTGMPGKNTENRARAEAILTAQAGWAQNATRAIFVPGNHDWQREKKEGKHYILNQQEWVTALNKSNVTFAPANACSGPFEIRLTDHLVLLIMDTQWPLHRFDKGISNDGCSTSTPEDLWKQLNAAYERNAGSKVMLAGHHPMISYGEHGGKFTIMDHLFPLTIINPNLYIPLPIVGSIYPLYRQIHGHRQDIRHPKYRLMSEVIRGIMAKYPGSIHVSGHEHALQYIVEDGSKFIVTGSGSKSSHVKKRGLSKFAASRQGFARIDVYGDGTLSLTFWVVDKRNPEGKIVLHTQL